jgi:hypothetical protein
MSSKPQQNSKPRVEATAQESISQIYPCAWRSEAGKIEKVGFPCIHSNGAYCKTPGTGG